MVAPIVLITNAVISDLTNTFFIQISPLVLI